jgi:hypothetical protein
MTSLKKRSGRTAAACVLPSDAAPPEARFALTPSLDRHLQTLAWCQLEEARGAPVRDAGIEAAARAAAPDLPGRIAARAAAFAGREGIAVLLGRHQARERALRRLLCLAGVVAGIVAARFLPEGLPARANVVALLGALLLPNLLSLALWLGLQAGAALRGRGVAATWLGEALERLADRAGSALPGGGDEAARAVQRALREFHFDHPAGRARLAGLSHLFWLFLALGSMLGCWWLLMLRQVDFHWGSTLLTEDQVARALALVGAPLGWLGLAVPDAADIAASRVDAGPQPSGLRMRWGWFVLGSLGVWGVLPRLAALLACLLGGRWFLRRTRLDLARPGFLRLRELLAPPVPASRILDADDAPTGPREVVDEAPPAPPPAGSAWLTLERALPVGADARDLGAVLDRGGQQRVLAALADAQDWPALVIQAPLVVTPDRGLVQFVAALVAAARRPVYLRVADDGHTGFGAAERAARIDDWRSLAHAAGIPPARVDACGVTAP